MRFHADLHVHSKYSRATSRDLDLEHVAHWAARKGIGVVATGDFTHPAWRAELNEKLVAAEPGLFRLRDDIEQAVAATLPAACRGAPVRFMLEVEISTIYKKGERTRKVHHLIYAPHFAAADRIAERLARIGNIASDGRPILGLDSRDLLEITLESDPGSYLVPAHIWTPWFAALGSQSGFDSIDECYGDLAGHIFAVETGLSSDPAMNWRISFLDRYRLVSNSDAHSPGKLGREATTFDCELDYFAMRHALETGHGFVGTVEFFPEEGKYHLDGHRKCEVRLTPRETLANDGRCPVCGEKVTIGVEHRVETLADRAENAVVPETAGAVSSLVPLPEIIAEIAASGPASRAVERSYDRTVAALGPELFILQDAPVGDIARSDEVLAEAISRLRAGKVLREAGYDGEYGVIRLFEDGEIARRHSGALLFDGPVHRRRPETKNGTTASSSNSNAGPAPCRNLPQREGVDGGDMSIKLRIDTEGILSKLDGDQRSAAGHVEGPLLIVAGPGSGKTRTLTHRIAHLIAECGILAAQCLAITFTRRAAAEMHERLAQLIPADAEPVAIHTFHSLGLAILREHPGAAGLERGFRIAGEAERADILAAALAVSPHKAATLLRAISKAKRTLHGDAEMAGTLAACRNALMARHIVDFDDLIALTVEALAADPALAALYRRRFRYVSVDEFQDLDEQQYRLLTLIAPPPRANLCVIGDPDQAIYGFRGADAACFERFRENYPDAKAVSLNRNYRSSGTIVTAAGQVIAAARPEERTAELIRDMHERINVHTAASEVAEAEFVVATIEQLIGGHNFFSIDSGRTHGEAGRDAYNFSFADFAVLYRTGAQAEPLREAFARSGMPFKQHAHAPLGDEPLVRALLAELQLGAGEADYPLVARLRAAAQRVKARREFDALKVEMALQRLVILANSGASDPTRLNDVVVTAREADFWDPRADRVSLLTLHAAKGLEFPVVFIVGLEDGILPLHWGTTEPTADAGAQTREERRLFYVGMTRAKDRLFLSRAGKRLWHGKMRMLGASPFLADIEKELVKYQLADGNRPRADDRQLKLF